MPLPNGTRPPPRRGPGRPAKGQVEDPPRKRLRPRTSPPPVATPKKTVPQGKKQKTKSTNNSKSATINHKVSDALLEVLLSLPTSDSSPGSGPSLHRCTCNHCDWQYFTGIRFKCSVCDDYDLCSPCYNRNIHDLTHPFMQITKPGGQPKYLSARCNVTSNTATPSSGTTASGSAKRATACVSQPFAASEQVMSPFFYKTLSTVDIKSFLTERGVEFGDVLDNETLCRRAWDTHCDCMTLAELNAFLSGRNISTAGCRDVNSRRQKAKAAFEPPSTRPPTSFNMSVQFRKDDMVILTGLNRAPEMNGKKAVVVSVNDSEGKALVRVEMLDRTVTFKVRLENLRMQDDGEAIEELE